MTLEHMWIKLSQAMFDLFGLIPDSADNMPDWIIERVQAAIKERDELRTSRTALQSALLDADNLICELRIQLKARNQSSVDAANTIADLRAKLDAYRAGTEFIQFERDELRAKLNAQTTAPNQSLRNKAYALAIAIRNVTDTCDLTTKIEALFQD